MLKGQKKCLNTQASIFLIFLVHSEKKNQLKNPFLIVFEILRLFVNILTADDKYSLPVKASV